VKSSRGISPLISAFVLLSIVGLAGGLFYEVLAQHAALSSSYDFQIVDAHIATFLYGSEVRFAVKNVGSVDIENAVILLYCEDNMPAYDANAGKVISGTVVQTVDDEGAQIGIGLFFNRPEAGQIITSQGTKTITRLSFALRATGNPSGQITFLVRRYDTDEIVQSKVLGDASQLTGSFTWYEVAFDQSVPINYPFKIGVRYEGQPSVFVKISSQNVAPEQWLYHDEEYPQKDANYRMTFENCDYGYVYISLGEIDRGQTRSASYAIPQGYFLPGKRYAAKVIAFGRGGEARRLAEIAVR